MKEIWKDIYFVENGITYDYRGLYQVSNLGRIKSYWFEKEKILVNLKNKYGYLKVCLCKEGKKKQFFIHRLVAQMFIPNSDNKPFINHKNGNKEENKIDNLEWCTYKENNAHAYKTGLNRGLKGKDNVCSKQVLQFDMEGNFIKEWGSTMDIQREMNISNSCISACCLGIYKQSHNYIWKYKDVV